MKKLAVVTGLVVFASACAEANPTQPEDLSPSFAKVDSRSVVHLAGGSGNIAADAPGRVFTFTAKEHADGSFSGNILLQFPSQDLTVRADVTCMRVEGNVAYVGGTNRKNSDFVGDVGFMVEDGGDAGPDRASLMYVSLTEFTAQDVCDGTLPTGPLNDVQRGSIHVR